MQLFFFSTGPFFFCLVSLVLCSRRTNLFSVSLQTSVPSPLPCFLSSFFVVTDLMAPATWRFIFIFFLFSWFLSCSCQLASALVLRRTRVFSRCVFVAPSFFFPCPSYFFVKGFFFLFHPRLFFFFPFCLFLFRHPRFAFLPFFFTPSFLSPSTRRFRAEFFCAFLCEGVLFFPPLVSYLFPPSFICTSF